MSLRNNLAQKARIYFRGNSTPNNFQEAQTIYEFFKKRGRLIEFKYARDAESRGFLPFGFIRYHDSEVTEQLLKEEKVSIDEIKKEFLIQSSNSNNYSSSVVRPQKLSPRYQYEGYFIDYNKLQQESEEKRALELQNRQIQEQKRESERREREQVREKERESERERKREQILQSQRESDGQKDVEEKRAPEHDGEMEKGKGKLQDQKYDYSVMDSYEPINKTLDLKLDQELLLKQQEEILSSIGFDETVKNNKNLGQKSDSAETEILLDEEFLKELISKTDTNDFTNPNDNLNDINKRKMVSDTAKSPVET